MTLRNWWPLFYWLIDVICINAYRLYQLSTTGKLLTHLQFRIELYYRLLGHSEKTKLRHLRVGLGGKRYLILIYSTYITGKSVLYKGTARGVHINQGAIRS
jgi:hypothetical protein